jgi:pimeloyl-ACP methyl ester carboxylesterase
MSALLPHAIDAELAALSDLVYGPDWDAVEQGAHALGWHLIGRFDHAGAEAMLCRRYPRNGTPARYALVFRGTEIGHFRWRDLAANVVGWPTPWAGPGRIHSGYWRQLTRILGRARDRYRAHDADLLVCGHSMGGALATAFAALVCAQGDRRPAALVTFGAPAALNARAAATIACPHRRYVVQGDPAPLWPPIRRLRHHTPAIRLPAPAMRLRRGLAGLWPLAHHDIAWYRASLEGLTR